MTSELFQLALLLLLAVLLGVLIPMLLEVRAAAKSFRKQMRSTGSRVDGFLEEARDTTRRIDGLSRALAGGDEPLRRLLASIGHTADALDRLERVTRFGTAVGAAVGPAVGAFVATMRETHATNERGRDERQPSSSDGEGTILSGNADRSGLRKEEQS